ncbi:MAG: peptidoglycan editing factor PgeF [Bacteroidota bacterium]
MKSDFQSDVNEKAVILPEIFSGYPKVRSGMSTKLGDKSRNGFEMNLSYNVGDYPPSVEMNRKSFLSLFGISNSELAIPLQSHSNIVCRVDAPGEYKNCDALVTNISEVALLITIADCVPILLFDPIQNAIGAVHAGWRGTANAIVNRTIYKMQEEFKTDTENVHVFIGPSAGVCCYEVSEEVAVKFENKIVPCGTTKIFVDLKKENASQLKQLGVVAENIEISAHCTICEKHLFHSYRRDGKRAGRMMAVICLNP